MSRYGRRRSCHERCEVRLRIVFSVITPEFHGKLSQDVRTAYIPDSSALWHFPLQENILACIMWFACFRVVAQFLYIANDLLSIVLKKKRQEKYEHNKLQSF